MVRPSFLHEMLHIGGMMMLKLWEWFCHSQKKFDDREWPIAVRARYDPDHGQVIVDLNNGFSIMFGLPDSDGLEEATPEQLAKIEISLDGYGLHWPDVDAELYLPAILDEFCSWVK